MNTHFKSLFIAATAILSLSACQKKTVLPQEGEQITINASAECSDAITKTALNDIQVEWCNGDKIKVFGTGIGADFTAENANETMADFNGIAPEGGVLWAIYPASAATGSSNTITIPTVQTYKATEVEMPMYSKIDDVEDAQFKQLCGVMKLQLKGDVKVRAITITSKSGNPIAGNASIDYNNGAPKLSGLDQNTITLQCDDKQLSNTVGTEFFIVLPPTGVREFVITVTTEDGKIMTKTTKKHNDNQIFRTRLLVMPPIDFVEDVPTP